MKKERTHTDSQTIRKKIYHFSQCDAYHVNFIVKQVYFYLRIVLININSEIINKI